MTEVSSTLFRTTTQENGRSSGFRPRSSRPELAAREVGAGKDYTVANCHISTEELHV